MLRKYEVKKITKDEIIYSVEKDGQALLLDLVLLHTLLLNKKYLLSFQYQYIICNFIIYCQILYDNWFQSKCTYMMLCYNKTIVSEVVNSHSEMKKCFGEW